MRIEASNGNVVFRRTGWVEFEWQPAPGKPRHRKNVIWLSPGQRARVLARLPAELEARRREAYSREWGTREGVVGAGQIRD